MEDERVAVGWAATSKSLSLKTQFESSRVRWISMIEAIELVAMSVMSSGTEHRSRNYSMHRSRRRGIGKSTASKIDLMIDNFLRDSLRGIKHNNS